MNRTTNSFSNQNFNESPWTKVPKRAKYFDITKVLEENEFNIDPALLDALTKYDLIYRTLCAILFNYVPKSGHPGGSVSSGRIVHSLMYSNMAYDFRQPDLNHADELCYAAGHKALGLYASLALRNECVRITEPKTLPEEKYQLRLEDLLGFRRNPTSDNKLFKKYQAKALDGHPTPCTPFVKVTTGASGVGDTTASGLALGALDYYGDNAPIINTLEGEGGMTPGRVQEAMAALASSQIHNFILHLDWNQSSIDSDNVCREGEEPGHYVQWTPAELCYINDFNVIQVPDGFDFKQILAAQTLALNFIKNKQPTAIIYRTTKGWKYGIEGCKSHGAGHNFCSKEFYAALADFEEKFQIKFPRPEDPNKCTPENSEELFFESLTKIREVLATTENGIAETLAKQIDIARLNLEDLDRKPRAKAPTLEKIYDEKILDHTKTPKELKLAPGNKATHRGALANTLAYLNKLSGGAMMASAADLFGSTNIANIAKNVSEGYYNSEQNPEARLIPIGGICEDAMGGFMSGLSSFGKHIGVASSYAAFIAPLQHIAARLHSIGQEAKVHAFGGKRNPFIMVCAHAGPKTGEDGPTHADPQALQLLSANFPKGALITLTPWDTQETWPLVAAALKARPAVIAPFVTRPSEEIVDRDAYNLPPAYAAINGLYALRKADDSQKRHGTIVLQGNGVGNEFVTKVLPELDKQNLNLNVYYVASAELFDMLSQEEQDAIFPEELASEAMGITEFTLATMYRWVTSTAGRDKTLHPFRKGHYLGSGSGDMLFKEAGLDAKGQLEGILEYINS